ncbi:fluoride efflux transporter CrcB [Erythrobacter insulae]|uniref:Fluoride-specific ion channel FluC n=1 Tax=Erythrobacter insulae TaxID=2584124 RepID=A0A547P9G0_9SPHN|nr:fluoride efflux transporter CrcB [Erythrobacter insulae]TRD10785.1 fluoride efflux transporter CrcB [Erythrobacter insulae]
MATPAVSSMAAALFVALGGATGSVARYFLGRSLTSVMGEGSYPWAILGINTLGSLAMGLVFGWFASHGGGTETQRLLFAVGLLGGFTTFSAFSLEIILMIQRGALGMAALFIAASVIAGVAALYLGLVVMKD